MLSAPTAEERTGGRRVDGRLGRHRERKGSHQGERGQGQAGSPCRHDRLHPGFSGDGEGRDSKGRARANPSAQDNIRRRTFRACVQKVSEPCRRGGRPGPE